MILWATDLHLNYFSDDFIKNFALSTRKKFINPKGLIISGDISLGNKLERQLNVLSDTLQIPIYFVLGNHDYWYSSFQEIDLLINKICQNSNIICLDNSSIIINDVEIIGFTGWYDCQFGEIDLSINMNDWVRIEEFKKSNNYLNISIERSKKFLLMERFIKNKHKINKQIIVTHFPPFESLIKNKGKAKPFYGCKSSGEMIVKIAEHYSNIIVLSGHTHNKAHIKINNINAYVGEACRGKPEICGYFDDNFNLTILN